MVVVFFVSLPAEFWRSDYLHPEQKKRLSKLGIPEPKPERRARRGGLAVDDEVGANREVDGKATITPSLQPTALASPTAQIYHTKQQLLLTFSSNSLTNLEYSLFVESIHVLSERRETKTSTFLVLMPNGQENTTA